MIKQFLTISSILAAGTLAASANGFYWVGGTSGTFGDENAWRYASGSTYYFVVPNTFDSVEAALAVTDKSSTSGGWKVVNTYSKSEGIDLTLSDVSAGTVISVDKVYAVNGFTTDKYYTAGNATLDFGTSGALFIYYTLKLANIKISVDLSDAVLDSATTRILAGVSTDGSAKLQGVDSNLSITDKSGLTSLGYFDSATEAEAALTAGTFAFYTEAISGSSSALKIVYMAIPEPSFFGLLAGTLALGLAGTRRRRHSAGTQK